MNMNLAADVVLWISIAIVGLLIRVYLPGYIKEKGKNLATKEDIAAITKQIEQVKVEYAKQLELYKSGIWQTQQRYLQMQEETKLKVDTFKKAVVDIAKIIDLIGIYQLHASNSEMTAAIAEIAHDKGNEKVQEESWRMHLEHKEKAATLYSDFRELIVELGGTFALFSIYFEPTLYESLQKIIAMGHRACELKMPPAEFRKRLEDECTKGLDLNTARANVGRHYDSLYDLNMIKIEAGLFFHRMKDYISVTGKETLTPEQN